MVYGACTIIVFIFGAWFQFYGERGWRRISGVVNCKVMDKQVVTLVCYMGMIKQSIQCRRMSHTYLNVLIPRRSIETILHREVAHGLHSAPGCVASLQGDLGQGLHVHNGLASGGILGHRKEDGAVYVNV